MASLTELIQAKQWISARWLRRGLRGGVVGLQPALSVSAAVASSGHSVHAVGVGRKVVDGKVTSDRCVRVFVVQKLAPSLLPPRNVIPPTIDGIPTDIIESPPAFIQPGKRGKGSRGSKGAKRRKTGKRATIIAAQATCSSIRRERLRPVVAGISVAHRNVTAGTIGYFCHSRRQGDSPTQVYVLSNNHVLADVNQGESGDDIYQPGPADGGVLQDHLAELHRFVPIQLDGTTPNRVDAAIGSLLPDADHRAELCSVGRITGVRAAEDMMEVCKHGRTTGYTEGIVTDVSYDALVGMDHNDPSVVALFAEQMRIEASPPHAAIGLGGDSGSLVVHTSTRSAVGLYFAGPPSGVYGIANHIEQVLNLLEIELIV